jgi:predicted lipoprotein with Yx(FWY)xxD motif
MNLKVRVTFFGLIILALALAGCAAPGNTAPVAQPTAAPAATMVPVVTAAPAATAVPVATAAPAATTASAPAAQAPAGPATVMVSKNDKLGQIVADSEGKTLYLYTKDTKDTSNCYEKCAQYWPPLLTTGAPKVGDGADAALLGTTARTDGSMQVTYNGWPLYYWIKDQKAGDATGQDVGGVWYVLSPMGEKVATPGAAASPAATSAAQAAPVKVAIKDFSFGAPLTITVGTTVEWTNEDSMAHTVTSSNGAFDSGNLDQGAKYSFTFTQEGTYNYVCKYHSSMKGQITVTK